MSEHITKRHNKNLLLYHLVCPAKYRRDIFSKEVEETLKEICVQLEEIYELVFVEFGSDEHHVHFLVQGVPIMAPSRMVQIIKA